MQKKKKCMKLNDWQQVNRLSYSKSLAVGEENLWFSYPDSVLHFLQRTEYYSLNRREIGYNSNVTDVKKILAVTPKNCFGPVSLYTLMTNKTREFYRLGEKILRT